MSGPAPVAPERARYEEPGAARRWPLMAAGLYGPLAGEAVCVVLGITVDPSWFAAMMFPLFVPVLIFIDLLRRNWPTGIRIDESGITIGAVGRRDGGRRSPTVVCQAYGTYRCPWEAVRAVRVATDPAEVKALRTSRAYLTLNNHWAPPKGSGAATFMIGVLTPPFMRAALVVDLDRDAVEAPPVRSSRFFTNGRNNRMTIRSHPEMSHTWIVPTRNPDRLREFLAEAGRVSSRA
jgi:hypothetical protein